jgi:hypothetical protein
MSGMAQGQLLVVCAAMLSAFAAPHAMAQSTAATLEAVNRASVAIIDVRVATKAMGTWGNNLLASHIAPGQRRRVLPERQDACVYFIRIVYNDNRYEHFPLIDLCRNTEYIFAAKTAQPITNQAPYTAPPSSEVTIANKSSRTISYIRMSSLNERVWGPDRLGEDRTLRAGENFKIPLAGSRGCLHRLRATYDDNLIEIVAPTNLCDDPTITLQRSVAIHSGEEPPNMRLTPTNALFASNQSGQQIESMFVFPRGERSYDRHGPDRLGNSLLPAGRPPMRIDVSDQNVCFVTVLARYQSRREEQQVVDLCAAHEPTVVMRGPSGSNPGGSPSRP